MKIVCIATSQIPSDTANSIQVVKTCQAMAQLGHAVHLLVPGRETTPWEHLAPYYGLTTAFQIQWLPAQAALKRYDFAGRAVYRARRLGASLLYTWTLQAAVAGLVLGLPVVLELHGPPDGRLGPHLLRSYSRLPGKKRLLPITSALASIIERDLGIAFSAAEVTIAPNGVDLERYQTLPKPAEARRLLKLPERFTVGYSGHLYPGRGMDLLMNLAVRFPDLQFLWVGGRPEDVSRWREKLAAAGVDNVQLTGFVENHRLPRFQAAADVLLMPYERVIEGSGGGNSADYCSPMKMFEYLASGRAIIASDLPVMREVLDDEVAILPPPEQVEPWAEALASLVAHPAERVALGLKARQRAQGYSWRSRAQRCLHDFEP